MLQQLRYWIDYQIDPAPGLMSRADYRQVKGLALHDSGTTTLLGQPFAFSDAEGFLHSLREIFIDRVYAFNARNDRPHIIDAGANMGLSVLYFKSLYPDATIVAYEPDRAIFELLTRNVAHCRGVDLRNAAAWVEDTQLSFFSEGALAGSSEMDFTGRGRAITVPAERLKTELAKRPVDFLKLDIEGAENHVLFDIVDELANVDHLFFEYHSVPGQPQQLGDLLNLVSAAGFRYTINGPVGARLPFVETVSHGFDLQLNIFCVRRDKAGATG